MRGCNLMDFIGDKNPYFADRRSKPTAGKATAVISRIVNEGLTDRQRDCISMYYGRNMNVHEIGEALSLNKSTVSRHLKAGKLRIREIMELSGVTEEIRFLS